MEMGKFFATAQGNSERCEGYEFKVLEYWIR